MVQKICVMITTQENKNFFASKKHLKELQEFANRFNMDIKLVKTCSKNIQSLENIAKLICNQNYTGLSVEYTNIHASNIRNKPSSQNQKIRQEIEKLFLHNKKTSLAEIKLALKKPDISASSLTLIFNEVKKNLSIKGMANKTIEKDKN